jgi:hypothetical protein
VIESGLGLRPTKGEGVRLVPFEEYIKAFATEGHDFQCLPIEDICLSLRAFDRLDAQTDLIGYISDASDKTMQYNIRFLCDYESDFHIQSLHDILQALHSSSPFAPKPDTIELCRRDRLFLAVILASSVLQLQGTWLKHSWNSHDIKFANLQADDYSPIKQPYLSWQVSGPFPVLLSCQDDSPPHKKTTSILLPLGISLIQLSVGRPIAALQQDEDAELTQIETTVKILDKVQQESGSTYSDVVKECLYWSQPGGLKFGYVKFDERVFEAVVSPLLRDLSSFDGISYWM